jgi:hypothetical protein
MRFIRFIAKALLVMMLLFDMDMIWHVWENPHPTVLIMKRISPDVISIHSRRIPYTIWDWVYLLIILAIHTILICFLVLSRRKTKALRVTHP